MDKKNDYTPLISLLIVMFGIIITWRAWINDDAYITFRTIDNFINGYGLTWNVGERVQVYTHPLWMFLLSGIYAITREIHFTSIAVSIIISIITIILFINKTAKPGFAGIIGIIALSSSKAYMDYATSGLENALSHLLLIIFLIQFFKLTASPSRKQLFAISLTASLGILTRMDLILVFGLPLLYVFWQHRSRQTFLQMSLGQLPFLLWEAFSLFYYGFLFPNTFYAKLNTAIPKHEIYRQGYLYFINSLEQDPITLLLILTGLLTAFRLKNIRLWLLGGSIILYLAYIIRIGGDFMGGRFFTVPLLLAIVILTKIDYSTTSDFNKGLMLAAIFVIGLQVPFATFDFSANILMNNQRSEYVDARGISDERLNYLPDTALLADTRSRTLPIHPWAWQGTRDRNTDRTYHIKGGIGFYGYHAGPDIYVIDRLALADPLLARLPAERNTYWRVGHYGRHLPDGYKETIQWPGNQIKDDNLARYYDKLSVITRGPLNSKSRLVLIWQINTGQFDHLIDRDFYRHPELITLSEKEASHPKELNTPWNDPANFVFGQSGLAVLFEAPQSATEIELSLSGNDDHEIVYLLAGEIVATQVSRAPEYPEGDLAILTLRVPAGISFDQVRVFPLLGDDQFSLGHLILIP